ncbi:MAG: hypothetical protein K5669_00915 [Lachnospiraceae bacterium]|nr:hypothetical protein [Lachnospiraceae bacterium]
MKAVKTYLSVYPFWYRFVVFIIEPAVIIAGGVINAASSTGDYKSGFIVGMSAAILIYAELFGEWFTLGEICVKRGAFGEAVLSSPRGRLFVKRFAVVDVLRKLIGYPLIFVIQQLLVYLIIPEDVNFADALVAGIICAASAMSGILVLRHTKAIAMRVVSYLAMGTTAAILAVPYFSTGVYGVKVFMTVVSALICALFSFLTVSTVIKSSKGDYYD